MKPIDRVRQLIDHKGLSISAFEKATGMSNNSIQTAIKRQSNLKDDTLNNILKTFPEISPEWLLTGNGPMLRAPENAVSETQTAYPGDKEYIIELQREFIEKLKREIDGLKK